MKPFDPSTNNASKSGVFLDHVDLIWNLVREEAIAAENLQGS